jgi:hypothetical protein
MPVKPSKPAMTASAKKKLDHISSDMDSLLLD